MLNKFLQTSCLTVAVGLSAVMGSDAAEAVIPEPHEIPYPSFDQILDHLQPSAPIRTEVRGKWFWQQRMAHETPINVSGRTWYIYLTISTPAYQYNEMPPAPPTLSREDIVFKPLIWNSLYSFGPDALDVNLDVEQPAGWPNGSRGSGVAMWWPGANTVPSSTHGVRVDFTPPYRFVY
jgi:hypothetical protein